MTGCNNMQFYLKFKNQDFIFLQFNTKQINFKVFT